MNIWVGKEGLEALISSRSSWRMLSEICGLQPDSWNENIKLNDCSICLNILAHYFLTCINIKYHIWSLEISDEQATSSLPGQCSSVLLVLRFFFFLPFYKQFFGLVQSSYPECHQHVYGKRMTGPTPLSVDSIIRNWAKVRSKAGNLWIHQNTNSWYPVSACKRCVIQIKIICSPFGCCLMCVTGVKEEQDRE